MSSTGNDIIDNRYNTYVPYNWKQQVANAFSSAIAYVFTAVQTFTVGIKTNDIFCETNGAIEATLFSDVGFGRDVVIGNALSNTLFNNVSALTANSGCNLLLNQVGGIGTLCDAPARTAPLNIYCRSAEAFDLNTIKIGTTSGGNTTTILEGITNITRLKTDFLDTSNTADDADVYSLNLTGYVKIADSPTRSGGVNIFSKGTTPANNTIKIGANSATTTELDGITKISNLTTTGNTLLDGGVVRIGTNGTNMELLQLNYVDNVGSTSYTITYPNAFTNAPVLTLSLERNNTTYSYYPQLIQSLTTGFTYRMMAITIGSNATSFVATDAHRLHFQTIEIS